MVVHLILKMLVEEAALPYMRGIRMWGGKAYYLIDNEIMLILSDA